jgi:hypothetical protein
LRSPDTPENKQTWRRALARRPRLAALLIYLGFAAIVFGRAAAPHFTTIYLGDGIDQAFFIWCLVWWPYAIAHYLNPFVTKLIFAPVGFNLTWSTSIPLLSLLAFALTATLGPITTFNLLCVVCPALSAWTAFLLCHSLTGRLGPSILGGYIFGFSSYMLAQMFGGHLNLLAAFLIPLALSVPGDRAAARAYRTADLYPEIPRPGDGAVSDHDRSSRHDDDLRCPRTGGGVDDGRT